MGMPETSPRTATVDAAIKTAFLVMDSETIPDGRLVSAVKYPGQNLSPEYAIVKAQAEARMNNWNHSEFLPVTFQIPVAICVIRVGADFTIQAMKCLDAPQFRPGEIVRNFWSGMALYNKAKLVTFNGRCFDLPLLEIAAFRYGYSARDHFQNNRNRYYGSIDLLDFFGNFGACRMEGGLNLLAKLLGKPGKTDVKGEDVYRLYLEGKLQEINDYCLCDTLDTYFVFLRTRILTGDITIEQESELKATAREFLESKIDDFPIIRTYMEKWTEFQSP
jgi:predicted PolB exonuclease-like 3'-5' exonuclease